MHDRLKTFLTANLKAGARLGVAESKIGQAIQGKMTQAFCYFSLVVDTLLLRTELTGIKCETGEMINELLRGARMHVEKMIKSLRSGDVDKAQLGLGHHYSRAKVKFNVNRVDNMFIQAIAILDQLDKDVNTFAMRIR